MDQDQQDGTKTSVPEKTDTHNKAADLSRKYFIIGLCVVILVGIGAFLMGRKGTNTADRSNETSSPTSKTAPITPPLQNNFYTINNKNGYSITHSGDLRISAQGMESVIDPSEEDAISIFDERVFSDTQLYPFMQIVAFTPDMTHYNVSTLSEIAEANLKENSENPNIPITIVEPLTETTFKDKKAYKYTFECQGFSGIIESMLGPKGTCKMIFTEHKGKFFFIGYHDTPEFENIVEYFKFN